MAKVAVIGAGTYGTALGGVLAGNGYDIDYYDPKIEREKLKDVVEGAKAVVLVAPSEIVMKLLSHLPKNKFLVVASKGFLTEKPFEAFMDWAVLSGAGFADDIKNSRRVHLTATDSRVVEMFMTENVVIDMTDDRLGVLMCGALKNVYAIRAGELGLRPKTKKQEDFIYGAVKEMGAILRANGAKPSTVSHACGMKDLILTCGEGSRNYRFGQMLRAGAFDGKLGMTVEGLTAIQRIKRGEIKVPETAVVLKDILEESEKWINRGDAEES